LRNSLSFIIFLYIHSFYFYDYIVFSQFLLNNYILIGWVKSGIIFMDFSCWLHQITQKQIKRQFVCLVYENIHYLLLRQILTVLFQIKQNYSISKSLKEKKYFPVVYQKMKKIPNQKNIINEPHVENEDDNSKIVRTNTFALTKQTSLISYISRPL